MKNVIKAVNLIKAHPKTERLLKIFCQDLQADYVRLLLHTQVRCLSKGKCLERFFALYETILDFADGRDLFEFMKSMESKTLIFYLADILEN